MWKYTVINLLLISAFAIAQNEPSYGTGKLNTLMEVPIKSPSPDVVVTMIQLILPPGDVGASPHYHPGPVFGYVTEGEFLFQMKSGAARIIPAGSSFQEDDGDVHVWGANASNETVCKAVAILYGRPGQPILTFTNDYVRTESREQVLARLAQEKTKA